MLSLVSLTRAPVDLSRSESLSPVITPTSLRRSARRGALLLASIAALLVLAAPASAANQTITSSGPLTQIVVSDTLGCQATYQGADPPGQFFDGTTGVHTCGSALAVGGTTFSFEDQRGGASPAYFQQAFTPVSQSAVTGAGTESDPYRVVTVVRAGETGLFLTETVSYVEGEETFRVDTEVDNRGESDQTAILYRFGDCYVGTTAPDRDSSSGIATPGGGAACQQPPGDPSAPFTVEFYPLSEGSSYGAGRYENSGAHITAGGPLRNEASPTPPAQEDSYLGLSWNLSVPAGGSVTRSLLTTASADAELPIITSKSARDSRTQEGQQNRYTITVSNRSDNPVTVNDITDVLPAGFSYVPGSTVGASEPRRDGRTLTFEGPFTVLAEGEQQVSFSVQVADGPGTYFNEADGHAGNTFVLGTGPTAPITVTAAPTPPPPADPCTIKASSRNDIIRGTSGNDVICGGGGNDIIYGLGGNDELRGGDGNDILRGGPGNDELEGGRGNDQLLGGDGRDRLVGGPGRDDLSGQGGGDSLDTRDNVRGNDVANGGAGSDSCSTDPRDVRTSCWASA